jgi:AraC-like DNA-binding protein/ligand-binding sensor protein
MNKNEELIQTLAKSQMFHDYERAYNETTNMPMALRSTTTWQLPFHGKRKENPFCALVASKSRTCAGCLQMQEKLCQKSAESPESSCAMECAYGLCEVALPVRLGNEIIGYLQTGQVMRHKPTLKQFQAAARQLEEQGLVMEREALEKAYFGTSVVTQKKLDSMTHLLSVLADYLSLKGNQIALQQANAEPPVITKAKQYIEEHHADDISLGEVAKAVHTSSFYFCKLFKRATGFNFTMFVSRLRVEKSKNLLLNPNLRVSEIAYEVGFQSLTHFNRIFKKITGQSPTEYRAQLPQAG